MKVWNSHNKTLVTVVFALIAWGAVFYFISPETLVEHVGIANSYLIAFLVTLAAGFSVLTGTAAYATVIELARGGVNPLILGLVSGVGLFLSDSGFYLLLMRGREALASRLHKGWIWRFHTFIEKLSPVAVYVSVYLFCAFGPIPNDLIIAILIFGGYNYKKVWPAFLAGDITFMLFLSYLFKS